MRLSCYCSHSVGEAIWLPRDDCPCSEMQPQFPSWIMATCGVILSGAIGPVLLAVVSGRWLYHVISGTQGNCRGQGFQLWQEKNRERGQRELEEGRAESGRAGTKSALIGGKKRQNTSKSRSKRETEKRPLHSIGLPP